MCSKNIYNLPVHVNSDYDGFEFFLNLYNELKDIYFEHIIINFKDTEWFDANLLAILGSIISYIKKENLNTVKIANINSKIRDTFRRNGFLSYYGQSRLLDNYGTTIYYRKFKPGDYKLFNEYLRDELMSKDGFKNISSELAKEIRKSIFEIFYNAVIHSDCKYIYTCGQYYYKQRKLDFTIVDMGKTIKKNVNDYLCKNLSGINSIDWAMQEGHTTKRENIPGGLGLKLIKEFLKINNGKIQVISFDGFWQQLQDKIRKETFDVNFPGTIVNLEFTIDNKFYFKLDDNIFDIEIDF